MELGGAGNVTARTCGPPAAHRPFSGDERADGGHARGRKRAGARRRPARAAPRRGRSSCYTDGPTSRACRWRASPSAAREHPIVIARARARGASRGTSDDALVLGVLVYYKIDVTLHTYGTNIDVAASTRRHAPHVQLTGRPRSPAAPRCTRAYPRFPFPHRSRRWPLLPGGLAKVIPSSDHGSAARNSPATSPRWASRTWLEQDVAPHPKPLLPGVTPGFNAGHLIALMLACDCSPVPPSYTEGLEAASRAALWRMTAPPPASRRGSAGSRSASGSGSPSSRATRWCSWRWRPSPCSRAPRS